MSAIRFETARISFTFASPDNVRVHMLHSVGSRILGDTRLAAALINEDISEAATAGCWELSR